MSVGWISLARFCLPGTHSPTSLVSSLVSRPYCSSQCFSCPDRQKCLGLTGRLRFVLQLQPLRMSVSPRTGKLAWRFQERPRSANRRYDDELARGMRALPLLQFGNAREFQDFLVNVSFRFCLCASQVLFLAPALPALESLQLGHNEISSLDATSDSAREF